MTHYTTHMIIWIIWRNNNLRRLLKISDFIKKVFIRLKVVKMVQLMSIMLFSLSVSEHAKSATPHFIQACFQIQLFDWSRISWFNWPKEKFKKQSKLKTHGELLGVTKDFSKSKEVKICAALQHVHHSQSYKFWKISENSHEKFNLIDLSSFWAYLVIEKMTA